jgi:hypothetical protein
MLQTLESFRDSVSPHVRQLLRLLADPCDELEEQLSLIEAVPEVRVSRMNKQDSAAWADALL